MDKIDKWLTIDELAGYIKMSRFDREEIDHWMKSHATGHTAGNRETKA